MKKVLINKNIKKILFVSLSNIGDAILTIPTLEALHLLYPNAVIDIIGDRRSKILFKYCPYLNNFFEKDKGLGWYGLFLLIKKIRQNNYEVAVDLRTDVFLYLVKSKRKFFKVSNKSSIHLHSAEKHFLAIKKLTQKKPPSVKIWLSDYEKVITNKIFSKYPNKKFLALGLGANFEGKIWGVDNFVSLVKLLENYFDIIILVGDENDAILAKSFSVQSNKRIIDCCGHYNLLGTAAIIKKSNFFIGNDSGLGHIASAVKVKSFTVFGVGQPHRYRPWSKKSFWIQDQDYQINNISSKIVADKIISLIN